MTKIRSISILVIIGLITVFFAFSSSLLTFNYDFESFFSAEDEDSKYYFNFRNKFENDSDFCLVGIENENGIFDSTFLKKVHQLTLDLKQIDSMETVQCITNSKTFIASSYTISPIKLVHLDDFSRLEGDSTNIYNLKEMLGTFVSQKGNALTIFTKKVTSKLTKVEDSKRKKEIETRWMHQVDSVVATYSFDEVHTAGRIKSEGYYVQKMQFEMMVFMSISAVLIIIFLYIAFRSTWGVILPLFVVALSMVWVMGFIQLTGNKIEIMTVLLPTIMFVVGMSDVVHIVTKYLQELRNGKPKKDAIKLTLKEVGLATFLTSLTTAVGFLTLVTSGVRPIQNFGLFASMGVVFAFVLAFTLLPAVLFLMKTPSLETPKSNKMFWDKKLHRLFQWVLKSKKIIAFFALAITALSFYGISKIEVNAYLIDEVNDGDPLKDDFTFFEKHFSGARPFEVALEIGDSASTLLDYNVLVEIDKLEKFLEEKGGVNKINSPLTIYKVINRAFHNGNKKSFVLPEKADFPKVNQLLRKFKNKKEFAMFLTKDKQLGRLSGILSDIGSKKSKILKDDFMKFITTEIDHDLLKPRLTGSAYLIDKTNDKLSLSMMQGLGLAFLVIAIIMGILFRSFRIVLVSFIPNVIPLLMIGAIIGFSGIGLKMSTSIIFTIAFGIAVDDTIHFMSKFKIELMKGRNYLYALKRTFIATGKAIVITSCILIAGFLTLLYSDFNGTFYTGFLVSLTLVFAVIADLLLIPVLLLTLVGNKQVERMARKFLK